MEQQLRKFKADIMKGLSNLFGIKQTHPSVQSKDSPIAPLRDLRANHSTSAHPVVKGAN
jgi:hypothetical protein